MSPIQRLIIRIISSIAIISLVIQIPESLLVILPVLTVLTIAMMPRATFTRKVRIPVNSDSNTQSSRRNRNERR